MSRGESRRPAKPVSTAVWKNAHEIVGLNDARRRASPGAGIVYEAIRSEGEEELARSKAALMWSGLAAGLSMGFSFLTETLLSLHFSETD